jgi:hypothetical protein
MYGLIEYGFSVTANKMVLVEPLIRIWLNTIESLPTIRVVNAMHFRLEIQKKMSIMLVDKSRAILDML